MHSIRLGPFLDYQKEGRISARVGWQAQVLAKHKQDRLHCRSWGAFLTAICVNLRTPGRIRTTHISQGHGPSVDGQYSLREARFCLERRLGADRKGKVESGVGHAQRTPLKGLRFESLEEAQAYLDHW